MVPQCLVEVRECDEALYAGGATESRGPFKIYGMVRRGKRSMIESPSIVIDLLSRSAWTSNWLWHWLRRRVADI